MSRGRLYDSNGRYLGQVNNFYTRLGEFRMTLELDNGNTLQFNPGELLRNAQGDWHVRSAKEHILDSLGYAHLADRMMEEANKKETANMTAACIKNVIFNPPATVVYWSDCTKTVVKCNVNDIFDPEKGLAMAIAKRCAGNTSAYHAEIRHWAAEFGKDYPGKPYTEGSSVENDALKKYIAQAKKSYEAALEAATKGNPVNFLSEMGRVSAALSMLEFEINK